MTRVRDISAAVSPGGVRSRARWSSELDARALACVRLATIRGGMYQGGELALQVGCGGFDSHPLHHFRARSVFGGTPGFQPGGAGSTPGGPTEGRRSSKPKGGGSSPSRGAIVFTHVAQRKESPASNRWGGGSNPSVGANVLVAQWIERRRAKPGLPEVRLLPGTPFSRGGAGAQRGLISLCPSGSTPGPATVSPLTIGSTRLSYGRRRRFDSARRDQRDVAQLEARRSGGPEVAGSIPAIPTKLRGVRFLGERLPYKQDELGSIPRPRTKSPGDGTLADVQR